MDEKLTIEQFGAKIKEKYPQYKDFSDADIGKRMISKYPQYAGRVAVPEAPKDTRDGLDKTVDALGTIFPGTKQIGESIADAGANIKNLVTGGREKFQEELPNNQVQVPELIGAYTAAAASAAGTAGAGVGGGLLKTALKSAGLGALIGGGDAAAEGGDMGDIAQGAGTGATIGAATAAAGAGIEAIGKGVSKLPERLVRSALGQSKKELLAGKDLSDYVIKNRKIGPAGKLIDDSVAQIDKLDRFIDTKLASVPVTKGKITTKSLISELTKQVNADGGAITEKEVRSIIENYAPQAKGLLKKPSMSLVTANKLRSSIDRTLGDKSFLANQLPFNKELVHGFNGLLREKVKTIAPDGVRPAFNSLSKEITLRDTLLNKTVGQDRNQIIGLGDLISGGLGSVLGGAPGIVLGAGVRRGLQSTPFLTGSAVAIDRLDNALTPVLQGLAPATQTAVINAIVQAFSPEKSQETD